MRINLTSQSMRDSKRELEQEQARISKLDELIRRLYEDSIEGKISDERFAKMAANYEAEQHILEMANLNHRFLHPPQSLKNRHSW